MNKIIVAICEGGHDIAFISRVLLAHGFNNYDKKIKDFFAPFDKKFFNAMASAKVDEKKLGYQPPPSEVPSMALSTENSLVFLHSMGGDTFREERINLINSYKNVKGQDGFSQYEFDFRFIYFLDADEIGVTGRLQQINEELQLENGIANNGDLIVHQGNEFGAYVFHDAANNMGTLENIVTNLLRVNGDREYIAANEFIENNMLDTERQKEIRYREGAQVYYGQPKFYKSKSTMSIMGQLQFSGSSNIVFIKNTDFIKLENIHACPHCTMITRLFS
ncbi:hypothetical protein SJU70_09045 [Aeromonas caviae]|uniref:hypothetical protein n=1 Tax=Aeromonas caviae TaxID=648 RepID=UPI0029D4B0AC|nr:hypothetical protein [Aeromonas caviae]MDX7891398.1 hypothetical protein [Aeromonas caviae]